MKYEDTSYYNVNDIQQILGYKSKNAAYSFIRKINEEMESSGFLIRKGYILKDYFDDRFANKFHRISICLTDKNMNTLIKMKESQGKKEMSVDKFVKEFIEEQIHSFRAE